MLQPTAAARICLTVMAMTLAGTRGYGSKLSVDICDYYAAIHKLHEHPECQPLDAHVAPSAAETHVFSGSSSAATIEVSAEKSELPSCSTHAALVQCTSEAEECPESGQICKQLDGSSCCQQPSQGIPVSHINAKAGKCPAPTGITAIQEAGGSPANGLLASTSGGCWLDSNCPGIQKCCLEPNPVSKTTKRICRDPLGISSESVCNLPLAVGTCTAPTTRFYFDSSTGKCKQFQYSGCGSNANNFQTMSSCQATCGYLADKILGVQGTPTCPADANSDLNCLLPHVDACRTDSDCLGRKNTVQPSCCMTKCGYRICYLY